MDFKERLDLYEEGEMITEEDRSQIEEVIKVFADKYGYTLEEENAATFIAHLCAALSRITSGESIEPVSEEIMAEIRGLASYPKSLDMLEDVVTVTKERLDAIERDYALLHINNLIATIDGQ